MLNLKPEEWEEPEMNRYKIFCLAYLTGELPPWFMSALLAINTIPLFKTSACDPELVRPVGVEHPMPRHLHPIVALHNRHNFVDHLIKRKLVIMPSMMYRFNMT